MAQDNQNRLNEMKRLSENVNWDNSQERCNLLDELDPLISDWQGEPPNLQEIFQPEQIESLLSDAVCHWANSQKYNLIERFVGFVAQSGYRHEPRLDSSDNPLGRTTALHHVYNRPHNWPSRVDPWANVVHSLFEIYNRTDLNYADEIGVTHYRVALKYNCQDFIKNFPEFINRESNDSVLPYRASVRSHAVNTTEYQPQAAFIQPPRLETYGPDESRLSQNNHIRNERMRNSQRMTVYDRNESRDSRRSTPLDVTPPRTLSRINDEVGQLAARVYAMDLHRRQLQQAIENFQPDTVESLLARNADLTGIVFPAEHFAAMRVAPLDFGRLRLASGVLACVEHLENKGYVLALSDALTIAKIFQRCEFLDRSVNVQLLRSRVISSESLTALMKSLMINRGLSVYNLIYEQPDSARTRGLTARDCYKYVRMDKIWVLLRGFGLEDSMVIAARLGQIMAREFCRRWGTILARLEDDEFFNSCVEAASL